MMGARYRLVRTIKSGGMAQVLEAVAIGAGGFERRVAVKRMLPHVAEKEEHRRLFLDEARLASRIHHGSVVQVLDYGQIDGDPLIVMEYVDGLDLAEATRRTEAAGGRVEPGIALHIACAG
jgi:serine/threonine-protein kinase